MTNPAQTETAAIKMANTWQMAAEDVLTVMLAEPKAFYTAAYDLDVMTLHFPPGELRTLYHTISEIKLTQDDGQPLSDTELVFKAKERVNDRTVNEIRAMYDPERSAKFKRNVEILKTLGRAQDTAEKLAQAKQDIINGADLDGVIGNLIGGLESEIGDTIDDCTATAALARFQALIAQGPAQMFQTSIPVVDDLYGGLLRKSIYWIAGQYKGGKSSAMRTAILGALRSGARVTLLTLEGYQEMVVSQFLAMLMAEYMLANGLYQQTRRRGDGMVMLSEIGPMAIMTAGNMYESLWFPEQVAAFKWAVSEFAKFGDRFRIYDPLASHGRASDLESIFRLLRKDQKQYGVDLGFIDYLGRIKRSARQSYFDLIDTASLDMQDFALSREIGIVVLAQLNEEAIKSGNNGASGVKGGGSPAATADGFWVIGDQGDEPPLGANDQNPMIRVELKFARYLPRMAKAARSQWYHIHSDSGYIIPKKYAEKYWQSIDLGNF